MNKPITLFVVATLAVFSGCSADNLPLGNYPKDLSTPTGSTQSITVPECATDDDCLADKPICQNEICVSDTTPPQTSDNCAAIVCETGFTCKNGQCSKDTTDVTNIPANETLQNLLVNPSVKEPADNKTINSVGSISLLSGIKDKLNAIGSFFNNTEKTDTDDTPSLFAPLHVTKIAPSTFNTNERVSTSTRLFAQFDDDVDCDKLDKKSPFVIEQAGQGGYAPETQSTWNLVCSGNFIIAINNSQLAANSLFRVTLPVSSVVSVSGKRILEPVSAAFATRTSPVRKAVDKNKLELMRVLAGPQQPDTDRKIYPNQNLGSDPFHGQIAIFDAENIMVGWIAYTNPGVGGDNKTHVVIGHYNSLTDELNIAEPVNDQPDADTSKGSAHHNPSVFYDNLGYGYVTYFASHAWQGDGPPNAATKNPVGFAGPIIKKSKVPFPKNASDWGPQVRGRMNGSNCDEIVTTVSAANGHIYMLCGNTGADMDEIEPCVDPNGKICWVGDGARQVISNDRTAKGSPADGLIANRMIKARLFADRNPLGAQKLYMIWGYSGILSVGSFDNTGYGLDHHRVYFAYSDDYGKTWKSRDDSKIVHTKAIPLSNGLFYSNDDPIDCNANAHECNGPLSSADPAFALTETRSTRYKTLFADDDGTIYIAFNKSLFLDHGNCIKLVKCETSENGCFNGGLCSLTSDGNLDSSTSCTDSKAIFKCATAKDDNGKTFVPDMNKDYGAMMLAKFKLGAGEPVEEHKVSIGLDSVPFSGAYNKGIHGIAEGVGSLYVAGNEVHVWYPVPTKGLQSIEEAISTDGGNTWSYENILEKDTALSDAGISFCPGCKNGVTSFRPTWIYGVSGSEDFSDIIGMAYGVGYSEDGTNSRLMHHGLHYYQRVFPNVGRE